VGWIGSGLVTSGLFEARRAVVALEESMVANLTIYQAVCLEEGVGGAETWQLHLCRTPAPLSRP